MHSKIIIQISLKSISTQCNNRIHSPGANEDLRPFKPQITRKNQMEFLFGWIDKFTIDIFICSFSEPNWFPEKFGDIGMEKYEELDLLVSSFTQINSIVK